MFEEILGKSGLQVKGYQQYSMLLYPKKSRVYVIVNTSKVLGITGKEVEVSAAVPTPRLPPSGPRMTPPPLSSDLAQGVSRSADTLEGLNHKQSTSLIFNFKNHNSRSKLPRFFISAP